MVSRLWYDKDRPFGEGEPMKHPFRNNLILGFGFGIEGCFFLHSLIIEPTWQLALLTPLVFFMCGDCYADAYRYAVETITIEHAEKPKQREFFW